MDDSKVYTPQQQIRQEKHKICLRKGNKVTLIYKLNFVSFLYSLLKNTVECIICKNETMMYTWETLKDWLSTLAAN